MILAVYYRNVLFRKGWIHLIIFSLFLTAGCASQKANRYEEPYENTKKEASSSTMPYKVQNTTYYPISNSAGFKQTGIASWYGPNFNGKLTSNQEVYNMNAMTAAHKTLPFNTMVKVTNLENGKEAVVRINDRGPFVKYRIIDLSFKAAKILGVVEKGTVRVQLTALASEGSDTNTENDGHTDQAKSFAIQIASFQKLDNAKLLVEKTENSRIKSVTKNNMTFYQVIIGKYSTFDDAHLQMENLRNRGYHNAFVVSSN